MIPKCQLVNPDLPSEELYKTFIDNDEGIVCGDIIGWDIVWKCCLVYLLHYVVQFINLIFVSIGGSAVCREENWDVKDFSIAWMDMYEYMKNNNLEL